MREHGILNRVMLVYEECVSRLKNNKDFSSEILTSAAGIVRSFIEDYHEKQEEDYLFPRFKKAGKLTDLVVTLKNQHDAGRVLTEHIKQTSAKGLKTSKDKEAIMQNIEAFIRFYRPHESWEDTVLFPALRSVTSEDEFESLGETFEKNEHKHFGKGGFEMFVDKVAQLEKELGIHDLSQFTPELKK
jgi:hemerythrin-like domain-containing protein